WSRSARQAPLALSPARIETLADGVFAIAMTLLVLPSRARGRSLHSLRKLRSTRLSSSALTCDRPRRNPLNKPRGRLVGLHDCRLAERVHQRGGTGGGEHGQREHGGSGVRASVREAMAAARLRLRSPPRRRGP